MTKHKIYSIEDLRKLNPCYDPTQYLAEDWQGTVVDILQVAGCPAEDRIWVATQFIDDRTNRLFAVWCAREALSLVANPDERSVTACDVAERFANGEAEATIIELAAASVAAWDAWDAARHAIAAARHAASAAARAAAWDARDARDAAWDAARDAQIKQLIKMLG